MGVRKSATFNDHLRYSPALTMVKSKDKPLALPLIALQYHEVKINLELREKTDCYWAAANSALTTPTMSAVTVGSLASASLYVDYIYLDTDERRRFAQVSHEYLIEQLQFTGDESTSNTNNKVKLNFNHPVKELVWIVQKDDNVDATVSGAVYGKQWFNYTDDMDYTYVPGASVSAAGAFTSNVTLVSPSTALGGDAGSMPGVAAGGANNVYIPVSFENGSNPVSLAKLQLNGHDRFSERDGRYFNLVQPYQHHENVPSAGINVYSFGLKPEEHQPSGTCNMSRIDNATLQLTLSAQTLMGTNKTAKIRVYAVNYNVNVALKSYLIRQNGLLSYINQLCSHEEPVASCNKSLLQRNTLLIGKPLRAFFTKDYFEKNSLAKSKNLGIVKVRKIGQPACLLPTVCKLPNHGRASETERVLVSF